MSLLLHRYKKHALPILLFTLLWLYGFFVMGLVGEIGPGGSKRIVAIYEGFYTRDAMTFLMSFLPLKPQLAGVFLSYLGMILLIFSSTSIEKRTPLWIMSSYPVVVWLALLHGPDAIALGMMWCGIALLRQPSLLLKCLSIWFLIWAYHLKITVLPLFFACIPRYEIEIKNYTVRSAFAVLSIFVVYYIDLDWQWYILFLLSSPLSRPKLRSDWILGVICVGYTVYYLGDKIRPRYLIPLETYFIYLSVLRIKKHPKVICIITVLLSLLSIDRIHAWCSVFQQYDQIQCPIYPITTNLSTLTHSDHSYVGHRKLKEILNRSHPVRGVLLPYLRDAREFDLRGWGYETNTDVVIMSQSNCCRRKETTEECSQRLVNNITQFGGSLVVPSSFDVERRVPPQHLKFVHTIQNQIQTLDIHIDKYWYIYTPTTKRQELPLPCQKIKKHQ